MCVYTEQMSNKLLTVFHKGFAGFIGGSDRLENEAENLAWLAARSGEGCKISTVCPLGQLYEANRK